MSDQTDAPEQAEQPASSSPDQQVDVDTRGGDANVTVPHDAPRETEEKLSEGKKPGAF